MRTLLFSLLLASVPAQATVNAYLDRYTITEGNSIRLTLESDQAGGLSPDLSPLHKEFQILGSKKLSITSKTSDSRQSSARWQVLLRPKRPGSLKLPPIQVGAESSSEMEVLVERADRSRTFATTSLTTLELMADSTSVYKDSQLIVTLRLTDNMALPPESVLKVPQIPNATVLPFGAAAQRQAVRRGQIFNLLERRFLVFPQESGMLTIPPQTLILPDQASEMRQVISEPLTIEVRPAVRQKSRGFWLPASNVTLTDEMELPANLTVGETVERTLTMTAQGIRADELPALTPLKNELATIDVIDIQRNERFDSSGIISTRMETVRITPLERGEITLPAIEIPWWNTTDDRSHAVALASRQFSASPAPAPVAAAQSDVAAETASDTSTDATGNTGLYGLIAGGIALLGGLLVMARRRKGGTEATAENSLSAEEVNAYETLTMACQQTDPFLAQQALLLWAQEFWHELPIRTIADVAQAAGSETFDLLIEDLQQHVDAASDDWQGDLMLQAVTMLRNIDQPA